MAKYCQKVDTRLEGPWVFGELRTCKKTVNITTAEDMMKLDKSEAIKLTPTEYLKWKAIKPDEIKRGTDPQPFPHQLHPWQSILTDMI